MGVMQNFGSNLLGSFAAPLVLVAIARIYHWPAAFFVAGIPGLIMATLIARYVKERRCMPSAILRAPAALAWAPWKCFGTAIYGFAY